MYVRVRAYSGSKKNNIKRLSDDRFEIQVREPAQQNLANYRLRQLLASEFGVNDKAVRLVSGHHSPTKIFDVITK